ncbi:MAG: hypothetical protein R2716_05775 [Microthrixaceae bacterium]
MLFFALTIFDGMMWGKVTQGVFWRWEPRLVTTTVPAAHLHRVPRRAVDPLGSAHCAWNAGAVIGIMAVVNIPITHKAVDFGAGLHQSGTVLGTVDPDMSGTQLFTTYLSLAVFMVVFA